MSKLHSDKRILLTSLDLSIRCLQCLESQKILYLEQLSQMKRSDLLKFKNFGNRTLKELDEILNEQGLSWQKEEE